MTSIAMQTRYRVEGMDCASCAGKIDTAVTILTSFDDASLEVIGFSGGVERNVERLARLAESCGLDGVVCSAQEAALLRGH